MAQLNAVPVEVRGTFTTGDLADVPDGRTLVLMDIEGGELALLDPDEAPDLSRVDHLVERHDFVNPSIKETNLARFRNTHEARLIATKATEGSGLPGVVGTLGPRFGRAPTVPDGVGLLTRGQR